MTEGFMETNVTRVLIVDDDPKQRESLGDVVESFGYSVDAAATQDQAREMIKAKGPYHLVLLDYMFGPNQKTGLDGLGEFRQLLPVEEVPILLMTGYATLDVAVRALRQGLSDFLIKPIDPNYLKHTLARHLEKARLLKENQRLFAELQAKNQELAVLSELKSKFISFCAHDLSNTISSSTMATDLLIHALKGTDNAQVKKLLGLLDDSLIQTRRLVGDLVDWSSIEKGKFKIDKRETPLSQILAAPIFTYIVEKAKTKSVTVEITQNMDTQMKALMDASRIIQVITNLLENALRYTPSSGKMGCVIEKDRTDHAFVIRIFDSGEGVDNEDLPHIFESFYQGRDPNKRRGRLGLGLSIAKEIVEGHGGSIWADSEGKGKGAVFGFKIPLQ